MKSAYNKALGYIARQDRTERQVRMYLTRAEYETEEIERAIDKLKDKKLLDDDKYARTVMAGKIKRKHYSTVRARQYLYSEGVDEQLVGEIVEGLGADYEEEAAEHFILKEMKRTYSGKSRREKIEKIAQKAARHGYSYAAIMSVIDRLTEDEEEE